METEVIKQLRGWLSQESNKLNFKLASSLPERRERDSLEEPSGVKTNLKDYSLESRKTELAKTVG